MTRYKIGLDIGSTTVKIAVMDENLNVIFDGDKIRTMTANILLNPDVSDGFELH